MFSFHIVIGYINNPRKFAQDINKIGGAKEVWDCNVQVIHEDDRSVAYISVDTNEEEDHA